MLFKNLLLGIGLLGISLSVHAQYGEDMGSNADLPLTARAHACMNQSRFREAEKLYRQELLRNNVPTILQLLSQSLIMQEKFYEADSILNSLVALDSNAEQNYWFLALSAERQSDDKRTLFLFKKYISKSQQRIRNTHSHDTENPKAWLKMGSIFRRKMHTKGINHDEWMEMMYNFEVYLRLNPEDPYSDKLNDFLEQSRQRRPEPKGILLWDEKP